MSLVDLILLAVALGIDCLVVSFSQGLIFKNQRIKNALKLAVTMGLFQGAMPIIGYVGTSYLYNLLVPYSKWIIFGIFFVLGAKFIVEAFNPQEDELQCIDLKCLIGMGVATSIDALVSGATLKLTHTNLLLAFGIIGFASFIMSVAGFSCGNFVRKIPSKYLEISGGLILIILALKSII